MHPLTVTQSLSHSFIHRLKLIYPTPTCSHSITLSVIHSQKLDTAPTRSHSITHRHSFALHPLTVTQSLSHSFIHRNSFALHPLAVTQSLTDTHLPCTHSQSLICPAPTLSITLSLIHSHKLIYPAPTCSHSITHRHSFALHHSLSLNHSFIHSSIHLSICSFIHLFINKVIYFLFNSKLINYTYTYNMRDPYSCSYFIPFQFGAVLC